MMDVIYFGDEEDSLEVEETFIKKIKGRCGDGILRDAYDSFKGHRQEVYLPDETQDNYFSWIIAKGYKKLPRKPRPLAVGMNWWQNNLKRAWHIVTW